MCSLLLLEASRLSPYTPPATDAGDDSVDSRPTKFQKKTFTDTEVSSPLSVEEGSGAFRKHRDTGEGGLSRSGGGGKNSRGDTQPQAQEVRCLDEEEEGVIYRVYAAEEDECLGNIAQKFQVSAERLLKLNEGRYAGMP